MQTTSSDMNRGDDTNHYVADSGKKPVLLFYCQSSLGIGHTMRSLRLIEALSENYQVSFLNGGKTIEDAQYPNINITNLPAIVADAEFEKLRPLEENLSLEAVFQKRRELLLATLEERRPQVLIVELYPFGRGSFGEELVPLLKQAKRQEAYIVSSVRDILASRADHARYEQKVIDRMNRYFDALLIHGDPRFYPLDESFSRLSDIKASIHYTGYVVPQVANQSIEKNNNSIIASIGGGRFGHELAVAVTLAARHLQDKIPHRITLYTGPFCPPEVSSTLRQAAEGCTNLVIEEFTENLHRKLQSADLSISLGGYNTTMDVLATGVRSLMMPCQNNGGMDQAPRLARLADMGVVELIQDSDLKPKRLARKIVNTLQQSCVTQDINLNGAKNTATIITQLLNGMKSVTGGV